ncbi:MAG: alpha/beta hydrolase [Planctomycetaceae bacterium]|nr:alpha/beta hydrolase [Planctomycetaceae bacterium]
MTNLRRLVQDPGVFAAIICLLIGSTGLSQDKQPPTIAKPAAPVPDAERLIYKTVGDVELPLYVVKPNDWQAGDSRPAVVFYFGGGWRGGNPSQFEAQAKYFASRGMVAVCVEYRVESRHQVKVADCVADAKSAFRWVRGHASELGVDPDRIVASGGSAGGHLAAAVGVLEGFDDPQDDLSISCRPSAMVLFNPGLDLTREGYNVSPDDERYQSRLKQLDGKVLELSPLEHVRPGLPPCLIFHGKQDTTVPFSQATDFCAAMTKAGNQCEVVGYEDYKHGFFNSFRDDKWPYYDTVRRMDEFLAGMGYLEGSPTIEVPDESPMP